MVLNDFWGVGRVGRLAAAGPSFGKDNMLTSPNGFYVVALVLHGVLWFLSGLFVGIAYERQRKEER